MASHLRNGFRSLMRLYCVSGPSAMRDRGSSEPLFSWEQVFLTNLAPTIRYTFQVSLRQAGGKASNLSMMTYTPNE